MQLSIITIKHTLLAIIVVVGIGFTQSNPLQAAPATGRSIDPQINSAIDTTAVKPDASTTSTAASDLIKWNAPSISASATSQDRIINHSFTFINNTNKTVTITNVEASCGCTHANFSPTPVKPGQNGIVTLSIALKGRREPFDVSAAVSFSNDIAPQVLKCTIIPYGYINIEPRVLAWTKNEQWNPKTLMIDLSHAKDSLLEKSSILSNDNFSINSEYDSQNSLWKLSVLPKSKTPRVEILMLSFVNAKHEKRQFFLALKTE